MEKNNFALFKVGEFKGGHWVKNYDLALMSSSELPSGQGVSNRQGHSINVKQMKPIKIKKTKQRNLIWYSLVEAKKETLKNYRTQYDARMLRTG